MMSIFEFLSSYRVKKGARYTHLGMNIFKGRYAIPENEYDKFWKLYHNYVYVEQKTCDLIENHDSICCLLYDLDFKLPLDHEGRAYDETMICKFIDCVTKIISQIFDEPFESFECFVFEKAKPTHKSTGATVLKDGLHLMFPYIVTEPGVQEYIRNELLVELEEIGIFEKGFILNDVNDIVDKTIISKNGWMIVGGNKTDGLPYSLTGIYTYNNIEEIGKNLPHKKQESIYYNNTSVEFLKLCSIRNYNIGADIARLKVDMKEIIEEYIDNYNQDQNNKNIVALKKGHHNRGGNDIVYKPDISIVKEFIGILDEKRAFEYESWIMVGWLLFNISKGTDELLDTWIEFSKRAPMYASTAEEECTKEWRNMNRTGTNCIGFGSLHSWAKNDNEKAYYEIQNKDIDYLICQIVRNYSYETGIRNKQQTDVAKADMIYNIVDVFRNLYGNDFTVANFREKLWFKFTGIKWVACDSDVELRKLIQTEFRKKFEKCSLKYKKLALNEQNIKNPKKKKYQMIARELKKVCTKLRDPKFQKDLLDVACVQFWFEGDNNEKFEDKLNKKNHLILLNNGVYDLNKGEFREAQHNDYLTLSTKNDWQEFSWSDEIIIDIMKFMKELQPDDEERDYLLRCCSSFLHGDIIGEFFHIWVGAGGNGKSKLAELVRFAMGDLWASLEVSHLTQKRSGSEKASPQLARLKGKRVVFSQEPSGKETINVGILKELTGGDLIVARQLHKEHTEFIPQFNLVMTCNVLPKIEDDSDGTWRRIAALPFESKFKENPDPNDKYQHKIDKELNKKLKQWNKAFFWILTEHYEQFKQLQYKFPPKVIAMNKKYQSDNDNFGDFLPEYIEKGNQDDILSLDEIFPEFTHWYKQTIDDKAPFKKEFIKQAEKYTNCQIENKDGKKVWYGWRITDRNGKLSCIE